MQEIPSSATGTVKTAIDPDLSHGGDQHADEIELEFNLERPDDSIY
jgi:hypothetical protein